MSLERIRELVEHFRTTVSAPGADIPPTAPADPALEGALQPELGLQLLESMLLARHLDRIAHELRATGHGHYTICSSGHESNVVLGLLTSPEDPALLHYRSAALCVERARQRPNLDAVRDIALSLVASRDEPASGGRHKVFGHRQLGIIPQTSTIASHLPRAVGLAFALERRARLGLAPQGRSIVLCSFGDASINHSTALGALNAAGWVSHQNLKLPLLFVCEDNGLGISVRTPPGWVAARVAALPHVRPFFARGSDLAQTLRVAREAVEYCREQRQPALLHLECVRLLGHAGSDVDTSYRTSAELEQARREDPVSCHAVQLLRSGLASRAQLLELDAAAERRVNAAAELARHSPTLTSREQVMSALEFAPQPATTSLSGESSGDTSRERHVGRAESEPNEPLTLAQGMNRGLAQALAGIPNTLLFGEDVAKKGGVYGITKGLFDRFGAQRVFNTLLDEQTILGLALGAALAGLLPIAEIQYLAYLHNAEDQLRGEAATLRFFSNQTYQNPLLIRIAGLAYQKGFGGHFHNDNSLGVLRDVPGIAVAVPARADDALALLRGGLELAQSQGRVIVLVEPIALYHRRGLLREEDGAWLARDSGEVAEIGRARVYFPQARDLLVVTYGNGLALSLAAAERLRADGVQARVLDLRWIVPLPREDVLRQAHELGRVLVVDECRHSGNVSEQVAALLLDTQFRGAFRRLTSADSFIPLGEAARHVLVSEDEVVHAARALLAV